MKVIRFSIGIVVGIAVLAGGLVGASSASADGGQWIKAPRVINQCGLHCRTIGWSISTEYAQADWPLPRKCGGFKYQVLSSNKHIAYAKMVTPGRCMDASDFGLFLYSENMPGPAQYWEIIGSTSYDEMDQRRYCAMGDGVGGKSYVPADVIASLTPQIEATGICG